MGGPDAVRLTGREEAEEEAEHLCHHLLPHAAGQRRLSTLLQHASPHCRALVQGAILVLSQGAVPCSLLWHRVVAACLVSGASPGATADPHAALSGRPRGRGMHGAVMLAHHHRALRPGR